MEYIIIFVFPEMLLVNIQFKELFELTVETQASPLMSVSNLHPVFGVRTSRGVLL